MEQVEVFDLIRGGGGGGVDCEDGDETSFGVF